MTSNLHYTLLITLMASISTVSTNTRYTRTAMVFHWLVALLISANILLIWIVDLLPDERQRLAIDTHKSLGITVLGLAVLRLLWRFAHQPPELPGSYARWERRASKVAHGLLYALIFLMPLSGWLHDSAWKDAATHPMQLFGLVPWPRISLIMNLEPATKEMLHDAFGALHEWAGFTLYALFALHVAGALKHQWRDKHKELQRMWS
ncbi:Cytochrome b561 [Polaromonas vacuolata]|uniref:Cytochrome b561 n=2 Tax=Polaromonas vacuolata TaxID=37448 RepID=A0A6H2H6T9_9BURK|nr:Cytochrome b561 [Polaromonas vacuolata]